MEPSEDEVYAEFGMSWIAGGGLKEDVDAAYRMHQVRISHADKVADLRDAEAAYEADSSEANLQALCYAEEEVHMSAEANQGIL